MTVQLSPHKVSNILRGYFRGLPQVKLAKEAGIDQSSISHYASRFKNMAVKYGLPAAGKEYQVLNEVESLRCLSVELYKSKLTVDDARKGHDIIQAFSKLKVSSDQHFGLIQLCKKIEDAGFVEAAYLGRFPWRLVSSCQTFSHRRGAGGDLLILDCGLPS